MTVADESLSKHEIVNVRGITVAEFTKLVDIFTALILPHGQCGTLEVHVCIPSEKMANCMVVVQCRSAVAVKQKVSEKAPQIF